MKIKLKKLCIVLDINIRLFGADYFSLSLSDELAKFSQIQIKLE